MTYKIFTALKTNPRIINKITRKIIEKLELLFGIREQIKIKIGVSMNSTADV